METLTDALTRADTGSRYAIDRVLDSMTPQDADLLRATLAGPMSAAAIARALRLVGHDIHASSVKRWRDR